MLPFTVSRSKGRVPAGSALSETMMLPVRVLAVTRPVTLISTMFPLSVRASTEPSTLCTAMLPSRVRSVARWT